MRYHCATMAYEHMTFLMVSSIQTRLPSQAPGDSVNTSSQAFASMQWFGQFLHRSSQLHDLHHHFGGVDDDTLPFPPCPHTIEFELCVR